MQNGTTQEKKPNEGPNVLGEHIQTTDSIEPTQTTHWAYLDPYWGEKATRSHSYEGAQKNSKAGMYHI
jgi:hypothetical protein